MIPHLAALGLIAAVTAALVCAARRGPPERAGHIGRALGVVLLGYYAGESVVRLAVQGHSPWVVLPFELCSALFFVGAWAYLAGARLGFEVLYFWTFAGTLHALITPTPASPYPSLDFFRYFAAHGLLVVAAAFAALGLRRLPGPGGLRRALFALQGFVVLVAAVDLATGQNYLYLRAKPRGPTVLGPFGPWPWYLLGGEAIAVASFALWALPVSFFRERPTDLPDGPRLPGLFQMLRFLPRPFEFLEDCRRRYGDAFTMRLPGYGNIVMLCSPALVKQLFTARAGELLAGKANAFLTPALGEHSLLTSDGPGHDRHRKLLLPAFHGERMHVYGAVMADETRAALARMPVGEAFALRPFMRDIALNVILRAVFGLAPGAERDRLAQRLVDFLALPNPILTFIPHRWLDWPLSPLRAFQRRKARIDAALHAIIAQRRAAGAASDDILSLLLQARDEAGQLLSDLELRDELLTMLAAGHATTAAALCWALERLVATPDAMARLTRELDAARGDARPLHGLEYLEAVVRETLRLRPIFTDVLREVTGPYEVAGHRVPAGTRLAACIYLVHRREDLYPDSAAFRPERFLGAKPDPFAWLPFGGGARRCVGMGFALFQMKVVLGTLLTHARFASADGRSARVERDGITLAPRGGGRVVMVATALATR